MNVIGTIYKWRPSESELTISLDFLYSFEEFRLAISDCVLCYMNDKARRYESEYLDPIKTNSKTKGACKVVYYIPLHPAQSYETLYQK